ncbi:hypothetical protein QE152_g5842 [Popillia japonica]|uniref:Integrase catalytic domain-containing protein n=1 Tax=Popillia japonica TaxID=7064 RepID=A0AAW1MKF4_POPJA
MVRTFKEHLQRMDEEEDPQEVLDDFQFCYQNTIHRSTGRTHAELLYGRQLRTPVNRRSLPGKIVEQTGFYSYIVEIDGGRRRKEIKCGKERIRESTSKKIRFRTV